MKIKVITYSKDLPKDLVENKVCVVIDVFRATTTMLTLFKNGIKEIKVSDTPETAAALKKTHCLVGENQMYKLEGFDFGNSPYALSKLSFLSDKVAMITTNGTRALQYTDAAKKVFIAGFINFKALVKNLVSEQYEELVVVCSGSNGKKSMEDTLCAGAIVGEICQCKTLEDLNQEGFDALNAYCKNAVTLKRYLAASASGEKLLSAGFHRDFVYCLKQGVCDVVAEYKSRHVKPLLDRFV